jgi:hypothetical protein
LKLTSAKESFAKLTDQSLSEKDVYEFKHDIITLEPSKKERKELEEKKIKEEEERLAKALEKPQVAPIEETPKFVIELEEEAMPHTV